MNLSNLSPVFRKTPILSLFAIYVLLLQGQTANALDYYSFHYLNTSFSPVARGMGGCEINSTDAYSQINNPGAVGIFHLNRRLSFYFPYKLRLKEYTNSVFYLRSFSLSLGIPVNLKDRRLAFGIAYSNFSIDYYNKNTEFSSRNVEENNIFTISAAYYKRARIGIGYTLKQSKVEYFGNRDWSDFGVLIEVPFREFTEYEDFFESFDRGNIKHDIIASIALVKANADHFLINEFEDEFDMLPEINKFGFSISFTSNYKESELFLFKITHEINNALGRRSIDYRKYGIEIGAGGALYMRFGFWGADEFDENIRSYGIGFNLGGVTSLLYSTGKIKTVNPVAQYILKNITISADYARETCDDETVYESSDYFRISFSI